MKRQRTKVLKRRVAPVCAVPGRKFQEGPHDAGADAAAVLEISDVCKIIFSENQSYNRTMSYFMSDDFVLSTYDTYEDEVWLPITFLLANVCL